MCDKGIIATLPRIISTHERAPRRNACTRAKIETYVLGGQLAAKGTGLLVTQVGGDVPVTYNINTLKNGNA